MKTQVLLIALFLFAVTPAWASNVTAGDILAEAETYPDGSTGGQCKVFVQTVVWDVGLSLGTGYRRCYLEDGFEVMNWAEAIPGDVIQISHDIYPWYTDHVHTAIIRENNGDGTFDVIDSNWYLDEKVHRRSNWDPAASADSHTDWSAHIYRLEDVTSSDFTYGVWSDPGSTCYGPIKYFEDWTGWCYGHSDEFPEGYKVQSKFEINGISEDFRFRVEAWDATNAGNPSMAWSWTGDWNYVGYGWDRAYFTPGFYNPYDGDWQFKIFVDTVDNNDNYFTHIETANFTIEPNDFFYDLYAYQSDYWGDPYDYKGYTCYGPIVGGQETGWEYSCYQNNKSTVFITGQSPYVLVKIRDIREDHRFRAKIYKDGNLQNTVTTGWNYVTGEWEKAFFWNQIEVVTSGSWEIRVEVDTGLGFSEIDKINFAVIPQNPLPYDYIRNGTTCLGPVTGGAETNWLYTCENESTVFNTGDDVQALIYVENISAFHMFKVEAYKNGSYQWQWQEDARYPEWTWTYSTFTFSNEDCAAGNWEFKIFLDATGNYRQIDTIKYQVVDPPN